MRRLTTRLHSQLTLRWRAWVSNAIGERREQRSTRKPSHTWRLSKHNGRILKHTWLLLTLTSAKFGHDICEKNKLPFGSLVLPFDEENEQDMAFFPPLTPDCKSRFDRRVHTRSTVRPTSKTALCYTSSSAKYLHCTPTAFSWIISKICIYMRNK